MTASKKNRAESAGRSRSRGKPRTSVRAAHLLSEPELRRLIGKVLKLSDADETEVQIDAVSDALTRFANNTIPQNVAERQLTVSVRTVFDGRTARATTNKTDEESLRRVVASSSALARSQPRNPGLLPMPGPQKYPTVRRYFEATATASPQDRASAIVRTVRGAEEGGQTAAGIFSTGASESVLANTRGLFAPYQQTRAEFSVTLLEKDSSGWAKANSPDISSIDPYDLAARASRKAAASRASRTISPGHYTVVLEPAAVLDLVGFMFYDFSATAVHEQRSCLTDRIGKQVMGRNITLWDDVSHPLQLGPPYDGEGVPRQKVLLVERGVPRNLVYSRMTAKKLGAKPTGHGLPLPNEWGEAPLNLVLEGGPSSVEEMISSTSHGILVTRLWYIREVDPYEKILTGMTRDGTFLIEEGRVTGGIRNLRFNQGMLEMLSNVELLGPSARASGEEVFEMVVPPMKVRDFHFTEVTKF